tara:strand:+ start:116 stop:232 length:117 start_codon:yes stop_codon:yes gene_type:complete
MDDDELLARLYIKRRVSEITDELDRSSDIGEVSPPSMD